MRWPFPEPRRDPQLGAALRRIQPPPANPDADMLRSRILAAAQPRLTRYSAAPRWWEWISGSVRVVVPVALAASLLIALSLPDSRELAVHHPLTANAGADSALVVAVFSQEGGSGELMTQLVAPERDDWLLEQAFSR